MHQPSPLALYKIPVLYVVDTDSDDPQEIENHIKRNEGHFWTAAHKLCPDHISSESTRCENCIFDLNFFPHFPPALYALLGKRYYIYLVDIHAEYGQHLNRWDDKKYEAQASRFKARINQWFPQLSEQDVINGQHHIIPAIARLRHRVHPYVVWMSTVYEPKEALKIGSSVSHIARRGRDLDGILASAVNWLKSQILDGLHVPLPNQLVNLRTSDLYSLEYPVYIDFKDQCVKMTTGVEIVDASRKLVTAGLPTELGPTFVRDIQGGVDRGLTLRYLIRGGRIPRRLKDPKRPYGSKLFESEEPTSKRDERERQYPDLKTVRKLLEKKIETNSQFTFWNNLTGVDSISSVELAWRYLYHAIVRLFLYSRLAGENLSQLADTPLASDAELLSEPNPLLIAKQFLKSAERLGQDEFGEQSGDFELFWVPSVVSLAVDIEESPGSNISDRCHELRVKAPITILDRMLNDTKKKDEGFQRIAFFKHWYRSDGIHTLLRTIYEVETGKSKKEELKMAIFNLYSNGKSLHEHVFMRD